MRATRLLLGLCIVLGIFAFTFALPEGGFGKGKGGINNSNFIAANSKKAANQNAAANSNKFNNAVNFANANEATNANRLRNKWDKGNVAARKNNANIANIYGGGKGGFGKGKKGKALPNAKTVKNNNALKKANWNRGTAERDNVSKKRNNTVFNSKKNAANNAAKFNNNAANANNFVNANKKGGYGGIGIGLGAKKGGFRGKKF